MTIDDKIKDKKLQYDINREAAKISTLSSEKIDKYEYLAGEEILPSDQMIFTKTLQKMLKQDLTLLILKQINHCLKEKIKR